MVMLASTAAALGLDSAVIGFDAFTGFPARLLAARPLLRPGLRVHQPRRGWKRYCDADGIEIIPGDINETYRRLENEPLLLSFFDTDNYSPTKAALPLCIRQTVVGGSIVFDHVYSLDEVP